MKDIIITRLKGLEKFFDYLINNNATACFMVLFFNLVAYVTMDLKSEYFAFFTAIVSLLGVTVLFWLCVYRFIFFVKCYKTFTSEMFALFFTALANILAFASIYRVYGIEGDLGEVNDIGNCLYFSIVTWTTLGYGDFSPTADVKFFAAIEALFGYVYMAIFTGLFLTVFNVIRTSKNAEAEAEADKVDIKVLAALKSYEDAIAKASSSDREGIS